MAIIKFYNKLSKIWLNGYFKKGRKLFDVEFRKKIKKLVKKR